MVRPVRMPTRLCTRCGFRKHRARGLCTTCYKAERHAALDAGRWRPHRDPVVDGATAGEHLDRLEKAGVSRWQVVRMTGLAGKTVYGAVAGRNITERASSQILSVPLPHAAHAVVTDKAFVPACGTARRLQALQALGWPITALAQRLGNYQRGHLADVCRGDKPLVMAYTARQVAALYEELSATLGPSRRIRELARQRGWAPPLAWDEPDDEPEGRSLQLIDNPAAHPVGLRRTCATPAWESA